MPDNIIISYTSTLTVPQLDQTVPRINVGQVIDTQVNQYEPHDIDHKDVSAAVGDGTAYENTYKGSPVQSLTIAVNAIPQQTVVNGAETILGYWHWHELERSTRPGTVFLIDATNIIGIEEASIKVKRRQGDKRILSRWNNCYYSATLNLVRVN